MSLGPLIPCIPIAPELDLTPPAATVPPFSPVHFPPANFKAPRAVSVFAVPFLDWQFMSFVFGVIVLSALFVVVTAEAASTLCPTDAVVTSNGDR